MIDMRLFTHRIILSGVVMAMTAMITLVGFELLMAQELQFVHGLTPYQGWIVHAACDAGKWFQRTDCRYVGFTSGITLCGSGGHGTERRQFLRLVMTDFSSQQVQTGF